VDRLVASAILSEAYASLLPSLVFANSEGNSLNQCRLVSAAITIGCSYRVASNQKTDRWPRWIACYRNINSKWLIVHEQVSVPVDLGNGKAMLDLKP
jgi:hypothetical protein